MPAEPPYDVRGRLAGRVALVTGAGSTGGVPGIGWATSVLFARAGARVGVFDVRAEAAKATVADIEATGGEAVALVGDVRAGEDCRTAVRTVVDRWGGLDVLVNNAGITGEGRPVGEQDEAGWQLVMDVNARGVLLMSQHALAVMPDGAAIVNISSAAVGRPGNGTAYAASKAAVEALTRATAAQYGARRVRANCVSPGALWTDMVARLQEPERVEAVRAKRRAEALVDVEGTAWDAAYAVLFLAGPEAGWITGQVLAVDGGAPIRKH